MVTKYRISAGILRAKPMADGNDRRRKRGI
jgi:hypothetical protein